MKKISAFLFFYALLLLFPIASSADSKNEPVFLSNTTTKDDLLLFWDEKDLYVSTATRTAKRLSQTAENMVVITAKDIEDMNAHSVDEVLNLVPGVYIDPQGQDFGSSSLLRIQGSSERHVLVLVDGVELNNLLGGNALIRGLIPVGIVDRIEIIKGPASSAWGSSLGGVINIITKQAGDTRMPTGIVSASYGEKNSMDLSAQLAGGIGRLGYYLYAGRQSSDGLRTGKTYEDNNFYAKLKFQATNDTSLGFSMGVSRPEMGSGTISLHSSVVDIDVASKSNFDPFFMTLSLDTRITPELALNAYLSIFRQKYTQANILLTDYVYHSTPGNPAGDVVVSPAGSYYKGSFVDDEKTEAAGVKLVWDHGIHTVTLGADISHAGFDYTNNTPPRTISPSISKWSAFLNDTLSLGRLSVTPGVRYDYNDQSGAFISPSLGTTYKFSERTVARASVARGFNNPPLKWLSGDSLSTEKNPDLKMESVWSYQAGIESNVTDYVWLKATAFYHDMKDELIQVKGTTLPYKYDNGESVKRHGVELEAETAPVYNLSLKAGAAYVHINPEVITTKSYEHDMSSYVVSLKYDDKTSLMAQISAYRVLWGSQPVDGANYDNFIWDLNVRKTICKTELTSAEAFLTVHNLFNGEYYNIISFPNPDRWAEVGLRIKF